MFQGIWISTEWVLAGLALICFALLGIGIWLDYTGMIRRGENPWKP